MSIQTEQRFADPDESVDRLLNRLSGHAFEMEVDAPIIVDFGAGPIELGTFEVSFLVNVGPYGDYSLGEMTLHGRAPCKSPSATSRWKTSLVKLEVLRGTAPAFASLIEAAVKDHCSEQIESEIKERAYSAAEDQGSDDFED